MQLTHVDLFSGIGGFALAAKRCGVETVAFMEIDPFCSAVLAARFPGVPNWGDARYAYDALPWRPWLITAGVPCQPASVAGARKGSSDDRWLWPDFLRVVREVEPLWVLAENPLGIISLKPHGLAWIESELEASGYQVASHVIGAGHIGAPHERQRVWIVAHAAWDAGNERPERLRTGLASKSVVNPDECGRRIDQPGRGSDRGTAAGRTGAAKLLADSKEPGHEGSITTRRAWPDGRAPEHGWPSRPGQPQHEWEAPRVAQFPVGGAIDGLPVRLARFGNQCGLRAMGNAIIPQVAELFIKGMIEILE